MKEIKNLSRKFDFISFAFEGQTFGLLVLMLLLFSSSAIANNDISLTNKTNFKIDSEIYTDKEIYSLGEMVQIQGFFKIDFIFTSVMKYLTLVVSIVDWSDGSIDLLFDGSLEVITNTPIYLNSLDQVNNLQWICNKTGEFGIQIHLYENNKTNSIDISFIDARFLVIEDRIFVDIYTDYIIYSKSQNIKIYGVLIPNLNHTNVDIKINIKKGSKIIQNVYHIKHDLYISKEFFLILNFINILLMKVHFMDI